MDLSNLTKRIENNEQEVKALREKTRIMEMLEQYNADDRVVEFYKAIEEIKEAHKDRPLEQAMTQIPKLDEITEGFRPGELVVLSGPTGNGKTSLMQSLTHAFTEQAIKCLWFSFEVGPLDFAKKIGQTPAEFYIPKKMKESNLKWLKERSLEGMAKFGCRVIFIDHLHYLLSMKELANMSTSLVIGGVMRELKKFAVSTESIIFLSTHLSKTKLENVPDIDDLRDSSFIGQESDFVLMIWRVLAGEKRGSVKEYVGQQSRISVRKNRRNGNLGFVDVVYNNSRFAELDKLHDEEH